MLTESGRIVAIEGRFAWVETLRQSTCGSCAARSGCGHGLLNAARGNSSRGIVKALLPERGAQRFALNDTVELSLPERGFLGAALLLYTLPLCSMILAALAGESWLVSESMAQGEQDLRVLLSAVAGLLVGLWVVRVRAAASAGNPVFQPRVTARL